MTKRQTELTTGVFARPSPGRRRVGRAGPAIGVLLCTCAAALEARAEPEAIGAAIEDVPLFDAHLHYNRAAWEPWPVDRVLAILDRNGVAMALVSSTPDEGTLRLWEAAPGRVVPELRPYHDGVGQTNWTRADGMFDYLEQRMARYPHAGIGEFHLHRLDAADRPLLERVAALAMRHDALIHVHAGHEAVELLYELEPGLTVIWAHAGMVEPPAVLGRMFAAYATLHADTSYREHEILGDGGLDPAWRELILDYPDRLMIGSDTWTNSQWIRYDELIASNRKWLAELPPGIARMIAHQNAERVFGRTIKRNPPGKE